MRPDRVTPRRSAPRSIGPEAESSGATAKPASTTIDDRNHWGETFIDRAPFEDGGVFIANLFTGPARNPQSLEELRESIRARGPLGIEVLKAEFDQLHIDEHSPAPEVLQGVLLQKNLGFLYLYEGRLADAAAAFEKALALNQSASGPAQEEYDLKALLGIVALRRGEIENCIACVGPSSCILPISADAVHRQQAGSRDAIRHFTDYLAGRPGDLRVRWLLNLAYMTLGEYPAQVPQQHLIRLDAFASEADVGRFENIALRAGLTTRGPNLAGGSIFDDLDGDGLPDLFTTSIDSELGASFYRNRGDGTFEDRSSHAGLTEQIYALNVTRADYDNDGDLDLLLLRGGWEKPMRLTLLRNRGDGTFDDVTVAAGLGDPISSESAAWGDYDDDGFIDLFVSGEHLPHFTGPGATRPKPQSRCRLYHNRGNGTFVDVAPAAGVAAELCSKGSAWGDYDGDGRLDLFVSNYVGRCCLFHNDGDGKFHDVAASLGVAGESSNFASWFWDYDNDGLLDLFVNHNSYSLAEEVAYIVGEPRSQRSRPHLYRNMGRAGFRDVAAEVGLDRPFTPMGCNFGDIDNDGYLDVYLGTGGMSYEHLVPNRLFKNDGGRRFLDVTMSSGTGHLQKGHGVSFADYDGDGDLDLFVELGGAVPGDGSYNLLFQNPGHGGHWLKVKLVGTRTNRAAIGARIKADLKDPKGAIRSIYRTVGNNSSFGGNSLVELIGLGDARSVAAIEVWWPTSRATQVFRDLAADRTIEITEGEDTLTSLP
jgi:tetratricopeptide (TPR) repeat protein